MYFYVFVPEGLAGEDSHSETFHCDFYTGRLRPGNTDCRMLRRSGRIGASALSTLASMCQLGANVARKSLGRFRRCS